MKKEYKELFSKITPDEKLLDGVLDKATEKRTPMIWKKAGAAFLAMAMLLGCGGYFALNQGNDDILTTQESSLSGTPLNFSIIAYAADNNNGDKIVLNENDITLMDYKISIEKEANGYAVSGSSETGFSIDAKNISEVTFSCKGGTFDYIDGPLQKCLQDQGAYFSIIIPITDEENEEYLKLCQESESGYYPERKYFKALMEKNDYSEYFKGKSTNLDEYSIYYSDKEDYMNENQFLLLEDSDALNYWVRDTKEFTAKTYSNDDVISDVTYFPEEATDYLIDHPHTPYEELPSDEITITVKFKSGQSITKKLNVSFNKEGKMQFEYIK